MYLVAKFMPRILQDAAENGPYRVERKAAEAALAAKKAGSKDELCQAAQDIADYVQETS